MIFSQIFYFIWFFSEIRLSITETSPCQYQLLTLEFVVRLSISRRLSVGCFYSEQSAGGETENVAESQLHPGRHQGDHQGAREGQLTILGPAPLSLHGDDLT